MTKTAAAWTAAMGMLVSAGSLAAHHSLVLFDTSAPVWVKGTVVRFERINPHSRIYLDQEMGDGQVRRWAVDGGPGPDRLTRTGVDSDFLKAGDIIEACGFTLQEEVAAERALREPVDSNLDSATVNRFERFMNGHLVVMPDGRKLFWSDYGHLGRCLDPNDPEPLIR